MIQGLVTRAAWLLAAAGIALGAAGLAGGLDHPAGAGGRGELTLAADSAISPGLDAAARDLSKLAADVGSVGDLGRTALTALVARDTPALSAAIEAGSVRIAAIEADAAAIDARLAALPGVGPGMTGRLGAETLARHAIIRDALPAVDGLPDAWTRLAAASIPATELTRHLLAHDEIAGQAVLLGSGGQYSKALSMLAKAAAELAAGRSVRDRLAASVDVTTLDSWIGRNAAYDAALGALWQAMVDSDGRVTDAVREAARKTEAAKKLLPVDARALVVILGDVARGGLNQAVIEVERARGPLNDAVDAASGAAPPAEPAAESGGDPSTDPALPGARGSFPASP